MRTSTLMDGCRSVHMVMVDQRAFRPFIDMAPAPCFLFDRSPTLLVLPPVWLCAQTASEVGSYLRGLQGPIVVDPVMVSTSGPSETHICNR